MQALFEVPFDPDTRFPILPLKPDRSNFIVFDGSPVQGWCLTEVVTVAPPTARVLIETGPATMAILKSDPNLLWIVDME
jgi:hypothetical protein